MTDTNSAHEQDYGTWSGNDNKSNETLPPSRRDFIAAGLAGLAVAAGSSIEKATRMVDSVSKESSVGLGKALEDETQIEIPANLMTQIEANYEETPWLRDYLVGQLTAALNWETLTGESSGVREFINEETILLTRDNAWLPTFVNPNTPISAPTGDGYMLQSIGSNEVGWVATDEEAATALVFPLHLGLVSGAGDINDNLDLTVESTNPGDMYYLQGYGNGEIGFRFFNFDGEAGRIIATEIPMSRFENDSPYPMYQEGVMEGFSGPTILAMDTAPQSDTWQDTAWRAHDFYFVNLRPDANDNLRLTASLSNAEYDPTEFPYIDPTNVEG